MNYNDFFRLINKKELSGAYLMYGSEEFVKNSAISAAQNMIDEPVRIFNISTLTDPSIDAITEACETLPLFSEKKLVICYGLQNIPDPEPLLKYIDNVPESSILLIVVRGEVQERSKLLKAFKNIGHDVNFAELSQAEVIKWCMSYAVKNGAALDKNTAAVFVGLVGVDMTCVSNEMKKLVDLVGDGGVITPDVVSNCTISNVEVRIFEMLDCFLNKKIGDGMKSLHLLLQDENEALGIAAFLESRFKLMLEGKILMSEGNTVSQAVSKMEGSKYANEKACRAAVKYSVEQLSNLVTELADVGYKMMTSGIKVSTMVETIMLKFKW